MSHTKRAPDPGATPDAPSADFSKTAESASDLVAELGEVALDKFLADGPIRDVPFLGAALKVWLRPEARDVTPQRAPNPHRSRIEHACLLDGEVP